MWHYSLICDITHSYVTVTTYGTRIIAICNVISHAYGTRLIHCTWDTNQWARDMIADTCNVISVLVVCEVDIPRVTSHGTWLIVYVTWLIIHVAWFIIYVTRLMHTCDVTRVLVVWEVDIPRVTSHRTWLIIGVTWLMIYVTWLMHTCDMTRAGCLWSRHTLGVISHGT